MSLRNLDYLFSPKSVVLIGASDRPHSVGATVWTNLSRGYAAQGDPKLMAVNPRLTRLQNWPVYPDVASLPITP